MDSTTSREKKPQSIIPQALSAKFEGSFAYKTVKDRLPVILTKVIDRLFRDRIAVVSSHGEPAGEETKQIIGRLSKLRNEMQTNKPILPLTSDGSDVELWNSYLKTVLANGEALWFESSWLYVECYMYRRIKEAFELSSKLSEYDPFQEQKESLEGSIESMIMLTNHLKSILSKENNNCSSDQNVTQLIEVSLWGNRCDLSLSSGQEVSQNLDLIKQLNGLRSKILVNNSDLVLQMLSSVGRTKLFNLHVVLDNAGFELFTDLCLVHYLTATGLVSSTTFHVKKMPWFVSDTLAKDFHWLLQFLSSHPDQELSKLGAECSDMIQKRKWEIIGHDFWTTPFDFSHMKEFASDLYLNLSQADLILFKGDLNYRKLTGDLMWDTTVSFQTSLRGFQPAPLCSLRTIKADVVVGLSNGKAEEMDKIDPRWMVSGEYALVEYWKPSV